MAMLDPRNKALPRAVLYPVQFEPRPEAGIGRVIKDVIDRQALHATATDYINAIRLALDSSDENLSGIIPLTHGENVVRAYLQRLSAVLVESRAGLTAIATAGPLATS
jgi:Ribonuclease G/E